MGKPDGHRPAGTSHEQIHNSIHDASLPLQYSHSLTHTSVSAAIGHCPCVSGHWHQSCVTWAPGQTPLCVFHMSSDIDVNIVSHRHGREGSEEEFTKNGQYAKRRGGGGRKEVGRGRMKEEEFDGFLILVRNQTWLLPQLLEAVLVVRDQPTSCTLPTRPPLVSGCISDELFSCSDSSTLAGAETICFIFW